MITIMRIDDRLLHGQEAQSWASCYHLDRIYIINDEVMNDEFSKVTLRLAKPRQVEVLFSEVQSAGRILSEELASDRRVMVIVENFQDAKQVYGYIPQIRRINIGGQRKRPDQNTMKVNNYVVLSRRDVEICRYLNSRGVKLEIRQIPAEKELVLDVNRKEEP